jgi:hypothetical protein
VLHICGNTRLSVGSAACTNVVPKYLRIYNLEIHSKNRKQAHLLFAGDLVIPSDGTFVAYCVTMVQQMVGCHMTSLQK